LLKEQSKLSDEFQFAEGNGREISGYRLKFPQREFGIEKFTAKGLLTQGNGHAPNIAYMF
jgi:hypothetical protein